MPASNINLLPIELSAKSGVAKLAATLKRVSMFSVITFLVFGLMAGAFILVYSLDTNSIVKNNDNLASQIATLEDAEQKTVLIKDRLQKIKTLNAQTDILPAITGLKSVISGLPAGVTVADITMDSGKTVFAFNVADSSILVSFLSNLVVSSGYKQLTIKSFSFTPATGYLVSFETVSK